MVMLALTACAAPRYVGSLPPILTEEESQRPHVRLGRIQAAREVYGIADYSLPPDIYEWGLSAIRSEAAKMEADGVIFPEVKGHTDTWLLMPVTEYRATGIAIKFK